MATVHRIHQRSEQPPLVLQQPFIATTYTNPELFINIYNDQIQRTRRMCHYFENLHLRRQKATTSWMRLVGISKLEEGMKSRVANFIPTNVGSSQRRMNKNNNNRC